MAKKQWKGKGKAKSKETVKPKAEKKSEQWVEELKNEKFEQYYRVSYAQNMMPEEEWSMFLTSLKEPLPTTFRLAGSRETVHELNEIIRRTYVPQLSNVTFEGVKVPPPVQIPWYPDGLAWQLNVPKSVIRRSAEFKRFHNFLVYETDVGNISRQEAVSMIPPLFLNVEPHHLVMDMCAAPGSKTAQLLEAMHAPSITGGQIPSGLLIANDSDFKRTHLLVHQSSRLPSPALMVTNLDASNYPNIVLAHSDPSSRAKALSQPLETLKFDRILCDVPCSGDGTMRKNVGIWGHWQPMDGNGLHTLQTRILLRAMKLLKPSGRIVYSTCSLNPVENEAVIAAALKANPDFELVDVSSQLPNLIRKPGMETWNPVVDRELTAFPSYQAFLEDWKERHKSERMQQNQIKMTETHWPPGNVGMMNLSKCMRIYPHLQDMGGFFIAVLRRSRDAGGNVDKMSVNGKRAALTSPDAPGPDAKRFKDSTGPREPEQDHNPLQMSLDAPSSSEKDFSTIVTKDKETTATSLKTKEKDSFKEPPYTFLEPEHPQLQQTIQRLSLIPSFPKSNIFVRNPEGGISSVALRSLYLCNDLVKRVILANDFSKIRLVSAGTKAFTRQDTGSANTHEKTAFRQQFRILDDAVPVVLPFIPPSTVLSGRLCDLKLLLEGYYPLITSFEEPFQSLLGSQDNGNQLVRFEAGEWSGALLTHSLVLPLWKSSASLALMTDKKSKSALSLRVFGQDITIFGKEIGEKQAASQGRREAAAKEAEKVSEVGTDIDNVNEQEQDGTESLEEL